MEQVNGPTTTTTTATSNLTSLPHESPYPSVSVDEARHLILTQSSPPGIEVIGFTEAYGRVLAETIYADEPVPDSLTATMDGCALRTVGEDIAPGECLLTVGTPLGAVEIGLLATIGRTCIHVYRRPRVAVFSNGSELVEPGMPRQPGRRRDSNRYALLAAVHEAGGQAISLDIVHDDERVQREALVRALSRADIVVSSGGVSVGVRDLVRPLLAEHGTIHFGRVQMKPGQSTTFATVHGRLVFGLPGKPVSALVAFEVLVRPLLRQLQGDTAPGRPRVRVVLDEPFPSVPDRLSYHRAVVEWHNGRLTARSTGPQTSSRLLSLRGANALLIGPATDHVYAPGEELDALLIGTLQSTHPTTSSAKSQAAMEKIPAGGMDKQLHVSYTWVTQRKDSQRRLFGIVVGIPFPRALNWKTPGQASQW
ncbi:MAG: molybdopterin molybdotransferase MoeA [Chloroflexaceae bacterium]|nr:molybdopterin molybdotransferase MoeA [Chloroflexaceae bacterium]